MATPQEVHAKRLEAERQAKEGMKKLVHATELQKQAAEAEVRLKQEEARKAQEELRKQERDLARIRANTPA